MDKNMKPHKKASSQNYFALKSGYDQHTNRYNHMSTKMAANET